MGDLTVATMLRIVSSISTRCKQQHSDGIDERRVLACDQVQKSFQSNSPNSNAADAEESETIAQAFNAQEEH